MKSLFIAHFFEIVAPIRPCNIIMGSLDELGRDSAIPERGSASRACARSGI